MEFEREHKTEQIGASYDTDYKVITRCIPDCPACAQKELVKWIQRNYNSLRATGAFQINQDEWQSILKHFGLEV